MRGGGTWLLLVVTLAGCSVAERESQRARAAAARIGDRVEQRADAAGAKVRGFWQRLFPARSAERRPVRRSARAETQSPRYETVQPRYVGTEAPGD